MVPNLTLGHAIVVDSALRDEGTSHHYLAASRFVDADTDASVAIISALEQADIPYVRGRSWTTDAIYRETRERMTRRVDEGCIAVEMEAAAFFSIARYRGVRVGQLLYAGDALAGERWDSRDWTTAGDIRKVLFAVALAAAARMTSE